MEMEEVHRTKHIKIEETEFCDVFYFKYYIPIFVPWLFFKKLFTTYAE